MRRKARNGGKATVAVVAPFDTLVLDPNDEIPDVLGRVNGINIGLFMNRDGLSLSITTSFAHSDKGDSTVEWRGTTFALHAYLDSGVSLTAGLFFLLTGISRATFDLGIVF